MITSIIVLLITLSCAKSQVVLESTPFANSIEGSLLTFRDQPCGPSMWFGDAFTFLTCTIRSFELTTEGVDIFLHAHPPIITIPPGYFCYTERVPGPHYYIVCNTYGHVDISKWIELNYTTTTDESLVYQ